jgi:pantoate--beta-alanine ligase
MEIIETVGAMKELRRELRTQGRTVALVPTMGYLHEGHLSLMREGRKKAEVLVVSIYVNPTQFSPGEDFERYPRDLARDTDLCRREGVDIIFSPDNREIYPDGYLTYVEVEKITSALCGLTRPNYFRGVTTICTKLFNIVAPQVAIFGKKDYQQYQVIKKMVADLNLDLAIIGLPTLREPDGLAMSSRNVYLQPAERISARSLYEALVAAQAAYDRGERRAAAIEQLAREIIQARPFTQIDYAKIVGTRNMKEMDFIEQEAVLALAVRVGKTRLIDNHVLGEKL